MDVKIRYFWSPTGPSTVGGLCIQSKIYYLSTAGSRKPINWAGNPSTKALRAQFLTPEDAASFAQAQGLNVVL